MHRTGWYEVNGSTTLAASLITQASQDFEQNEDFLMKLVGQNQQIGSGPTGLYAAALPSFFSNAMAPGGLATPNIYNADPTNAYNWSIDTRLLQTAVCDGLWFDPFSFCQDVRCPPEVGVGGSEMLMLSW